MDGSVEPKSSVQRAPAGFYADPCGSQRLRWWTGSAWAGIWQAPAGYYRHTGSRRYWDGERWGARYWTWWRVLLTVIVTVVGSVIWVVAIGYLISEPEGSHAVAFERAKEVSAVGVFVVPCLGAWTLARGSPWLNPVRGGSNNKRFSASVTRTRTAPARRAAHAPIFTYTGASRDSHASHG